MLASIRRWWTRSPDVDLAFCTLAIHPAYRRLARQLVADLHPWPVVVLTDDVGDFDDLPVRAVHHEPTGPMAVDYVERPEWTGALYQGRGDAAYHDKRFALRATLDDHETAVFVDADSRVGRLGRVGPFPPGLALRPGEPQTVASHLASWGPWRLPAFEALSVELFGSTHVLNEAQWCNEACYAVTRDDGAPAFFEAWDRAADFMQSHGVYSGEGGVMGLAARYADWDVDRDALAAIHRRVRHVGGGPNVEA